MNRYLLPRSDNARLALLEQSQEKAAVDAAAGHVYLTPATVTAVQTFIPLFKTAIQDVQNRQAEKKLAVRQANEAIIKLKEHMRDTWSTILRRVRREQLPRAVLAYYMLPEHGRFPIPGSRGEWLVLATQMIEGDAAAASAGYPAMSNPSAEELQTALTAAYEAFDRRRDAQTVYSESRRTLAILRQQADEWVSDVINELRFALRKESRPYRRAVMRLYGAHFSQNEGEETESGETAENETVASESEAAMPAAIGETVLLPVPFPLNLNEDDDQRMPVLGTNGRHY